MDPYRPIHVPAMVLLHPNVIYIPSLDRIVNTIVGYRYQLTPRGPTDLPTGVDFMSNTPMYGAVRLTDPQNLAEILSDTYGDAQDGWLDDLLGTAGLDGNRPAQAPGAFGAGLPRVLRTGVARNGVPVTDATIYPHGPIDGIRFDDGYDNEDEEDYNVELHATPNLLAHDALSRYYADVNLSHVIPRDNLGLPCPLLSPMMYTELHARLVPFFTNPTLSVYWMSRGFIAGTIRDLWGVPAPMPNSAANPVTRAARLASVQRMPTSTPSRSGSSWGLPASYPSLTASAGPSTAGQGRTASYMPSSLRQTSNVWDQAERSSSNSHRGQSSATIRPSASVFQSSLKQSVNASDQPERASSNARQDQAPPSLPPAASYLQSSIYGRLGESAESNAIRSRPNGSSAHLHRAARHNGFFPTRGASGRSARPTPSHVPSGSSASYFGKGKGREHDPATPTADEKVAKDEKNVDDKGEAGTSSAPVSTVKPESEPTEDAAAAEKAKDKSKSTESEETVGTDEFLAEETTYKSE